MDHRRPIIRSIEEAEAMRAQLLNSPLTKSWRSDSIALLSLGANQRWRWDDQALFRMT